MRDKSRFRKSLGVENFITINGKQVDLYSAKIVYRCEVCYAELNYKDAGLICSQSTAHRGFIHRSEVAKIQQEQAANINQLNDFYQIINGKVVIRNGN